MRPVFVVLFALAAVGTARIRNDMYSMGKHPHYTSYGSTEGFVSRNNHPPVRTPVVWNWVTHPRAFLFQHDPTLMALVDRHMKRKGIIFYCLSGIFSRRLGRKQLMYILLYVTNKGLWKLQVTSQPGLEQGVIGVFGSIIDSQTVLTSNPPLMF